MTKAPPLILLLALAACSTQSSTLPTSPSSPTPSSSQVSLSRVEWGQSVLSSTPRLVAGKPALLRVYAVGAQAELPANLRAEVYLGSAFQGRLSLQGPPTLPTTPAGPGDLDSTYTATLPAGWVASGLEVRLYADSAGSSPLQTLKPTVGAGTVLYLTLVPILTQGQSTPPTLPPTDLLKDMLPVRDLQTLARAPFTYGAPFQGSSSDWSSLLSALSTLRSSDGSRRYYAGVVKVGYSSGIAGIGYIARGVSVSWDAANSSARVMTHELGHNLSMYHAPCGTSDGLETNWPSAYAGASIGSWGYSLSGTLYDPAKYKDVMSYCGPQWISDYTYSKIQAYLENNPPQAQSLVVAQEVLLVSGKVHKGELWLNPLQRVWAVPDPPQPGPYTLRLETPAGLREISFSSVPLEAPHGPGTDPDPGFAEEHFSFSIPNPGAVMGLEVRSGSRSLLQRAVGLRPQSAPGVSLGETNGVLSLKWDSASYPYASVAHLGAERTTLGLWLRGGSAQISTQGLLVGGRFEVVLSDGVNSVRLKFPR